MRWLFIFIFFYFFYFFFLHINISSRYNCDYVLFTALFNKNTNKNKYKNKNKYGHTCTGFIPVPEARTCARDRRALQQLALNVHVKYSDLT